MEIQEENNLIQEAFEVEADEVGFCLDQKWGDYENPYENSDTALAFNLFKKGWQAAKAIPDGFVAVNKKDLVKVLNCVTDDWLVDTDSFEEFKKIESLIQDEVNAMIEAQEPTND